VILAPLEWRPIAVADFNLDGKPERSMARHLRSRERRGAPKQRWLAFLQNHREAIFATSLYCAHGNSQSRA
jgi:hypothetical protein